MLKKYYKLKQEQKKRGVIFSSQLVPGTTIHEVFRGQDDRNEVIERLKDDKFFNNSHFEYNLIRQ